MLELAGVTSGYGRLPVLFGVDLEVQPGEMVAVVGANGAGKSTLMKTILGLVRCRDGSIHYDGRRMSHEPAHARFAAGISLCPEARRLFARLTVRENLLAGAFGQKRAVSNGQLDMVYTMFPVLQDRREQRAGSLSGGEQQMVAIGRALMSGPKLLLVDELSMGLAPLVVKHLLETLRALCDRGLGLIVVDQVARRMVGIADRGEVIEKGRIVFSGSVEEADLRLRQTYIGAQVLGDARKGK